MGTTKKKTKYAATRQLQSEAVAEKRVTMLHYITTPSTVVQITGELSEDAKSDLTHAIDEVLAFHKV